MTRRRFIAKEVFSANRLVLKPDVLAILSNTVKNIKNTRVSQRQAVLYIEDIKSLNKKQLQNLSAFVNFQTSDYGYTGEVYVKYKYADEVRLEISSAQVLLFSKTIDCINAVIKQTNPNMHKDIEISLDKSNCIIITYKKQKVCSFKLELNINFTENKATVLNQVKDVINLIEQCIVLKNKCSAIELNISNCTLSVGCADISYSYTHNQIKTYEFISQLNKLESLVDTLNTNQKLIEEAFKPQAKLINKLQAGEHDYRILSNQVLNTGSNEFYGLLTNIKSDFSRIFKVKDIEFA